MRKSKVITYVSVATCRSVGPETSAGWCLMRAEHSSDWGRLPPELRPEGRDSGKVARTEGGINVHSRRVGSST